MNLLLSIDDSSCSKAAVEAVQQQFNPATTTVRVLHVVEWPNELPPALAFAEGPAAADSVLAAHRKIRSRAEDLVARAIRELRDFTATGMVVEGDVRTEIVQTAAEWPADVIVLGSHRRKGIDWLLLGSVSNAVVRRAGCPVQVVELAAQPSRRRHSMPSELTSPLGIAAAGIGRVDDARETSTNAPSRTTRPSPAGRLEGS